VVGAEASRGVFVLEGPTPQPAGTPTSNRQPTPHPKASAHLDVPVGDPVHVQLLHRPDQLPHHEHRQLLADPPAVLGAGQESGERPAAGPLGDEAESVMQQLHAAGAQEADVRARVGREGCVGALLLVGGWGVGGRMGGRGWALHGVSALHAGGKLALLG